MLFDTWFGLLRVLVVGSLAYAALILILRVSGKRTLAKLNAFDLVVTVSLGSTLASVLVSKSVALAEGVLAMALLVLLQFLVAWATIRSPRFRWLVKAEPALLLRDGVFVEGALRRERLTQDEVIAAIRASGSAELADIGAVVLETDGSISVIASAKPGEAQSMRDVARADIASPSASS